jgi:hypothetical protein
VHAALEEVTAQDLHHYNAHCPHCRRVNRVSKKQLQRAAPNWTPEESLETSTSDAKIDEAADA